LDEEKARQVLAEAIDHDGGLYSLGWYISWSPGGDEICLDGSFSVEDLEAIIWWIKNKKAF
jgi:hypothetical protein